MKTPGTQPAYPTIHEIEQYVRGTLPSGRSREIELLALEDPMVADAIEGYAELPAFESVQELQFQPTPPSGGTPWWHLAGWGAGIAVGVILAVVLIPGSDKSGNEKQSAQAIQTEKQSDPQSNEITPSETTAEISQLESNAVVTTEPTQTGSTSAEKNALQNTGFDVVENPRNNTPEFPIETADNRIMVIEMDSDLPVLLDEERKDPALKDPIAPGGTDITHFNNYKLVDYTALRKKTWPDFSLDSLHTSPALENEFDKGDPLRTEITQSVPYITYLERCINEYSTGEFERAAEQFELILKQYPTDLNAQFYGAMSYYQTGDYEKAIELFNRSLKNVFKIFREESEFYKAVSLRKAGRDEESLILFLQIINNNGYYKERAMQEVRSFE